MFSVPLCLASQAIVRRTPLESENTNRKHRVQNRTWRRHQVPDRNQRAGRNCPAEQTVSSFCFGDTVIVNVNVVEGERKRVQAYEGVVIAKRNRASTARSSCTKISTVKVSSVRFSTHR